MTLDRFDADLVKNSKKPIETLVKVRWRQSWLVRSY